MSGEVEKILEVMAEKFGTTVDMLWNVLLRQMYIEAIGNFVYIVFILLGLALVSYGWFRAVRGYHNYVRQADENKRHLYSVNSFSEYFVLELDSLLPILLVILSVLLLVGLVSVPSLIIGGIGRFINPEYYALQEILKIF